MASFTEDLRLEYHQQDTTFYCGAACTQMVLHEIGAGYLPQDGLYNDTHLHSVLDRAVNWKSGPDGVEWTMNHRKPGSFRRVFNLFERVTEESISRKIIWTIHKYQVGAIALIQGFKHWIVIRGYQATAAPTSTRDISYAIIGFYVNDPFPVTPHPNGNGPRIEHAHNDGCGTGGNRGIADQFVAYDQWQNEYMTGVTSGHWTGKYLAVCDPEPPPDNPGEKITFKTFTDGSKIIDKEVAGKYAMWGLEEYGLDKRPIFVDVGKIEPGEPVLVERLDRPGKFYYIVPIVNSEKKIYSLVSIDAKYGNFHESAFAADKDHPIVFNALDGTMIKKLLGSKLKLKKKIIEFNPDAITIHPHLVWMPCMESLSAYWPFHLIVIDKYPVYIRIDGKVFMGKLHDDIAGF